MEFFTQISGYPLPHASLWSFQLDVCIPSQAFLPHNLQIQPFTKHCQLYLLSTLLVNLSSWCPRFSHCPCLRYHLPITIDCYFFFFFLPSVSSHSNEMIVFSHTTLFFLMFFIRFRTSLRSWHRQRDSDVRCGYYLIAELLLLLCLSCSLIPGLSNLQFQILRECLALSILGYSPYFLCLYHSYFCLFPIISYRNSSP